MKKLEMEQATEKDDFERKVNISTVPLGIKKHFVRNWLPVCETSRTAIKWPLSPAISKFLCRKKRNSIF